MFPFHLTHTWHLWPVKAIWIHKHLRCMTLGFVTSGLISNNLLFKKNFSHLKHGFHLKIWNNYQNSVSCTVKSVFVFGKIPLHDVLSSTNTVKNWSLAYHCQYRIRVLHCSLKSMMIPGRYHEWQQIKRDIKTCIFCSQQCGFHVYYKDNTKRWVIILMSDLKEPLKFTVASHTTPDNPQTMKTEKFIE